MVEKAVFISSIANLQYATREYSRLYFGVEFCERLLPTTEELSAALNFSKKNKMEMTFVTPFATDAGIVKLKTLMGHLLREKAKIEVVVNDWGFLNYLNKQEWDGPLALGRLLTKQKRGPRIMNIMEKLPVAAIEHFKQSNIDVPILVEFLIQKGIHRVELDNLLQGISRPDSKLKGSLYFPYAYVTTTRYCLMASGEHKTPVLRSILPCKKECQKYECILSHPSMPVGLLLKGNTQFFRNDRLPEDLETLNIDRLVFEPQIPL